MRCSACGNEIADDSRFCTNCGAPMETPAPVTQQTSAPRSVPVPQQAPTKPRSKMAIPITIAAIVIVAIIIVVAVVLLMPAKDEPSPATDTAATATQPAVASSTFENDFMRITLPEDVANQVSFSETNGWVVMTYVPSSGTLLSIYPVSRAPEHEMEDKADTYLLGEASVNGQTQQVMMRVDYFDSSNAPAHWSAQDANQLGIVKLFGMSPESFASHVELDTGSGFATAHASKIGGDASSNAQSAASGVPSSAFWGIWAQASKDKSEAEAAARRIKSDYGLDAFVVLTTDWNNLNSEPWYCVSIGSYATEDAAKAALSKARAAYPDAYVKYSGSRK